MQQTAISPSCLRDGLIAGCLRLIDSRNMLNELNVFPVPDGDTGTNMAATAAEIAYALEGISATSSQQVLRVATKAAITGARGNSGAILAQFLSSFTDRVLEVERPLDEDLIIDACNIGCYGARSAVVSPVEGTILTVMSKWSEELAACGRAPFASAWHNALIKARQALNMTQHQLRELTEAGVVDAGGLGFVAILEGVAEYLKTGVRDSFQQHNPHIDLAEIAHSSFDPSSPQYRFCTECLLSGEVLESSKIKQALEGMGDSLVVAGNKKFMRIHIHTDDAHRVFATLFTFGQITQQKADDMQAQVAQRQEKKDPNKVVIISDSCCDLPEEFIREHNINLVPLRMAIGDQTYIDKVTIHPDEFYEQLPDMIVPPKTSQPPSGDFERAYALAEDLSDNVVSIHMSQALSGTYQAALLSASKAAARIVCIDSKSVSVGLGLIVMAACAAREQNIGIKELAKRVELAASATNTFLLPESTTYLVRGGRLSAGLGRMIQLTGLVPILASREGKIGLGGLTFRGRLGLWLAAKWLAWRLKRYKQVNLAVAHGNSREKAEWFCSLITENCQVNKVYITELSPVLGVYAGPNALAVAFQELQDP